MNPVDYPPEVVPLKGRFDGVPGQPGGSTVVQYTTVNITTEPPQDHIIWSICCFAYSNLCCLGLVALIYSIKARDRKVAGDLDGAQHYGSTARCLNILATILTSIIVLIFIIMIIVVATKMKEMHRTIISFNYNWNYRG